MKRQPKLKRCKVCRTEFQPRAHFQVACKPDCALRLVEKKQERRRLSESRKIELEQRREHRAKLESVRPIRWYLAKAQETFNAYIRAKNQGASCISCGAPDSDKTHQAGHFRPAGINTALRFDERNCWPQCLQCNLHKSGNVAEYRRRLAVLIGESAVSELESNNEVKKWSKEELIEIRSHYKIKLAELKHDQHSP